MGRRILSSWSPCSLKWVKSSTMEGMEEARVSPEEEARDAFSSSLGNPESTVPAVRGRPEGSPGEALIMSLTPSSDSPILLSRLDPKAVSRGGESLVLE